MIELLINLLIFVLVLFIVWKIIEFAFSIFKVEFAGPLRNIIGLIFLLILVVQILGVFGYGTPLFHGYHTIN